MKLRALGEWSGAINAPRRHLLARILSVVGAERNAGWAKPSARAEWTSSLGTQPTDLSRLALDWRTLMGSGSSPGNADPTGSTCPTSTREEETPCPLAYQLVWTNRMPADRDIRMAHLGIRGGAVSAPCRQKAPWMQFVGGCPRLGRKTRKCSAAARAPSTLLKFEGTAKCLGRQSTLGKAARRKGSMPRILTWHGRLPIMPNA